MLMGTIAHRALEHFYDHASFRTPEALETHCHEAMQEFGGDVADVCHDSSEAAALHQDVLDLTAHIFQVEVPEDVNVLATEARYSISLPDYDLRGIIDRVDQEPDGSITLVDYKTGRVPSKADEKDALRSLMLYSLMWDEAYPTRKANHVKLIYLKGTPKRMKPIVISAGVTSAAQKAALDRTSAVAAAILAAKERDYFGANVGPLCGWCPYTDRCVEGDAYLRARGK
jgi:putative RecB family exonuclease